MSADLTQEKEPITWRTEIFGTPVVFVHHGGSYVDVIANEKAVHALNVWDYATARTEIHSAPQLERKAKEWIEDLTEREWAEYLFAARS